MSLRFGRLRAVPGILPSVLILAACLLGPTAEGWAQGAPAIPDARPLPPAARTLWADVASHSAAEPSPEVRARIERAVSDPDPRLAREALLVRGFMASGEDPLPGMLSDWKRAARLAESVGDHAGHFEAEGLVAILELASNRQSGIARLRRIEIAARCLPAPGAATGRSLLYLGAILHSVGEADTIAAHLLAAGAAILDREARGSLDQACALYNVECGENLSGSPGLEGDRLEQAWKIFERLDPDSDVASIVFLGRTARRFDEDVATVDVDQARERLRRVEPGVEPPDPARDPEAFREAIGIFRPGSRIGGLLVADGADASDGQAVILPLPSAQDPARQGLTYSLPGVEDASEAESEQDPFLQEMQQAERLTAHFEALRTALLLRRGLGGLGLAEPGPGSALGESMSGETMPSPGEVLEIDRIQQQINEQIVEFARRSQELMSGQVDRTKWRKLSPEAEQLWQEREASPDFQQGLVAARKSLEEFHKKLGLPVPQQGERESAPPPDMVPPGGGLIEGALAPPGTARDWKELARVQAGVFDGQLDTRTRPSTEGLTGLFDVMVAGWDVMERNRRVDRLRGRPCPEVAAEIALRDSVEERASRVQAAFEADAPASMRHVFGDFGEASSDGMSAPEFVARLDRIQKERARRIGTDARPFDPVRFVSELPAGAAVLLMNGGDSPPSVTILRSSAAPGATTPREPEVLRASLASSSEAAYLRVGKFRQLLSDARTPSATLLAEGHAMWTWLLPTPEMRGAVLAAKSLVVIPMGLLSDVCVAALVPDPAAAPAYFGLRLPIVHGQSLRALHHATRPRPAPGAGGSRASAAVILGDPVLESPSPHAQAVLGVLPTPLPAARAEAESVAAIYGEAALVGTDARESLLRARLPGARIVHIAAHGFRPSREIMATGKLVGMLLAQPRGGDGAEDGLLTAEELGRVSPFEAELVVFSGCETGKGWWGMGAVGEMAQSSIVAGARSVIVAQWRVPDATGPALMTRLHRELRAGTARDEALRRAMAAVAAGEGTSTPYHWASYRLVGDPSSLP